MLILQGLLSIVYVFACLFLIFVVMIQKGEGGGLGGAFGGGAVDNAFGSTADMTWKKATAYAAGLFIVLSMVLGLLEVPPKTDLKKTLDGDKATMGSPKDDKGSSETTPPEDSGKIKISTPGQDDEGEGEGSSEEGATDKPADEPTDKPADAPSDSE